MKKIYFCSVNSSKENIYTIQVQALDNLLRARMRAPLTHFSHHSIFPWCFKFEPIFSKVCVCVSA